jgi:hypothetical protein
MRERLLAPALFLAKPSQVFAKALPYIHAPLETRLSTIDLQTISDIAVDFVRHGSVRAPSLIVYRGADEREKSRASRRSSRSGRRAERDPILHFQIDRWGIQSCREWSARMTLILLHDAAQPLIISREAEGEARREDVLRDLIFAHPQILPVRDIDPGYGHLVAVAKELVIPDVGRVDALLVDQHGRLVIVECKLWRNPQARREVVGQILDYARELARFDYEVLQKQISIATGRTGNVLFELVCEAGHAVDEARFVDQVSRNLAQGRFLLLVVGDGITEGTQRIGEFLNTHAGLAFDFALIELARYRFDDPATGVPQSIVQPRLIARTALIERTVIRNEAVGVTIEDIADVTPVAPVRRAASGTVDRAGQNAWRDFFERFVSSIRFDDPGQPAPKYGGLGWMRVPLPGPSHLTLWRGKDEGMVGAFVTYRGSEGAALYERLLAEREAVDTEFIEAGLPAPDWAQKPDGSSITLRWPSPAPWSEEEEARQSELLTAAARQFVNSLRQRPLRDGVSQS